jgi:hypothetical protein
MSKSFAWMLVALMFVLTVSIEVDARGRRRGGSSSSTTGSHMDYHPSEESTAKKYNDRSLQDIAMERAAAMARQQNLSHNVGGCTSWQGLGVSEGIGSSTVSDHRRCSTCITGSRVVADGFARSINGMIYRVRFFR